MLDEDELYKIIGERLAAARKRKRTLTQGEAATRLGITRTSVSNIERGKQKAPLHLIYKYCQIVEKTVTDILPSLDIVVKANNKESVIIDGDAVPVSSAVADWIREINNIHTSK